MFELLAAYGLDRLLGDPVYSWHPVRVLRGVIQKSEAWLRARVSHEKTAGLFLAAFVPLSTFVFIWFLCELAAQIHPALKTVLTVYFIYSAIAVEDLKNEARRVYAALLNGKLEAARKNLSRIVGRDTESLCEEEVVRGTVETVAESFVDGIWSPLFYAALGGAPLALAYKAVNTLDSLVGHRTPRYREFGFFSAKLDEILNWIPARLTLFLIPAGTFLTNGRFLEAMRAGWICGAVTTRQNSAIPEAAFAGALGIQLGGVNFYQGERVVMPKLGYSMKHLEVADVRAAYRLMLASSWIALAASILLQALAGWAREMILRPL